MAIFLKWRFDVEDWPRETNVSGSRSPALMETLLLKVQPTHLQHRQHLPARQNGHSQTPVLTSGSDRCEGPVKRWTGTSIESGLFFLVRPQGTCSCPAQPEGRELSDYMSLNSQGLLSINT